MDTHTYMLTEPCPTCHGTGRVAAKWGKGVHHTRTVIVRCPNCGGTGEITRPLETMTVEAFFTRMGA